MMNTNINKENLRFILDFGIERLYVPAHGVTIEKADYNEIDEINHLLSIEKDIAREEDFEAEKSAAEIFAG